MGLRDAERKRPPGSNRQPRVARIRQDAGPTAPDSDAPRAYCPRSDRAVPPPRTATNPPGRPMTIPMLAWFVGAMRDKLAQDATADFVAQEIWECEPSADARNHLRAMQPGDRVAIKSAFVTRRHLPFDNRGLPVSTMRIKAIGTIREVLADACKVRIAWDADFTPRDWYFFTGRTTIWRVDGGTWKTDALLNFAFNNARQDYDAFRNDPFWAGRFGDHAPRSATASVPGWVPFHEALADQLLTFAEDRGPLIAALHKLTPPTGSLPLRDQVAPNTWQPLDDICPFTVLALIHRGMTLANRRTLARMMGHAIGVDLEPPSDFLGVPVANNQSTWFFSYSMDRKADDIDRLWHVLVAAHEWEASPSPQSRAAMTAAFDAALEVRQVKWNLTIGLFWCFPRTFLPLDSATRKWLKREWELPTPRRRGGGPPNGETYLAFCESVQQRLDARTEAPFTFVELSEAAFHSGGGEDATAEDDLDAEVFDTATAEDDLATEAPNQGAAPVPRTPYTLTDILHDGAFQSTDALNEMLSEWKRKKNLILQGTPGTGKTWLAQRLGWALVGVRKPAEVVTVQFHPGVSYEDFVRGYRPGANERFEQVDGPFMRLVSQALANPHTPHVLVIEEINRGNPAHIFGELLTLIEASKREPEYAMELTHPPKSGRVPEYVPPNLYLVGTMNLADRSIALVDVALRRRFAFFTLEPQFNEAWRNYLLNKGVQPSVIDAVRARLLRLNDSISADPRLGVSFVVGHSFVTPNEPLPADDDGSAWFRQIVRTEIQPLVEEYCFDSPKVVKGWCDALRLDRA